LSKIEVEDTFAEAFSGIYCRVIITADDQETLRKAAEHATATPSVVINRVEAGIERYLKAEETPDGRVGALLQFWGGLNLKTFEESLRKFQNELSYRIRQDILVKPFTAVYDALPNPEGKLDMMETVGHCGDGYEWVEQRFGREVIVVPLMVPDFVIEHYLGWAHGVSGGNFWIMCTTKQAVKESGQKALEAVHSVGGVVTPFDVCSAGSKPETHFPKIGPTTNHYYCPSLKERLGSTSKVPEGVNYISEIVYDAVDLETLKKATKVGIEAAMQVEGVVKISAGNYEGKLGEYKISLRELWQ
jgi:formylmethanofuran--tetrahydromethanopterin N-formyltransferase